MDANQLFKAFNNINIAIIGDVIIDRYLNGNVDRISPEAPVPIIHLKREDNRLGGSGNVALNIKAMGATPFLFSVIGDDENGEIFKKLMPENNLWQNGILRSKERCTTVKTRVMANNQQLLRVDREDTIDLSKSEEDNFINKIKTFLAGQNIDVIILQDYNKGVLSLPVISKILSLAEKNEIPIVVDPKKVNFLAYKNVEIFKPNLKEIQESTPFQVLPNLDSLKKASEFLRKKTKFPDGVVGVFHRRWGLRGGSEPKSAILPGTLPGHLEVPGPSYPHVHAQGTFHWHWAPLGTTHGLVTGLKRG